MAILSFISFKFRFIVEFYVVKMLQLSLDTKTAWKVSDEDHVLAEKNQHLIAANAAGNAPTSCLKYPAVSGCDVKLL